MTYKPPKNEKAIELTKSYTDRVYAVSLLPYIFSATGDRGCIWCGDPLKTRHPAARYCKDEFCTKSAYAWASPQKEEGLNFLLMRQNFCCNICGHDYKPFIESALIGRYGIRNNLGYRTTLSFNLMKALKRHLDAKLRPEVDHVVPIFKGGNSLGLGNHQILCALCHKAKTKADVTGTKRPKKSL